MKLHHRFSPCRNCQHAYSAHCMHTDVKQGDILLDLVAVFEMVPCNNYLCVTKDGIIMENKLCNCAEWIPGDNLEYLEWKHNKKGEETK